MKRRFDARAAARRHQGSHGHELEALLLLFGLAGGRKTERSPLLRPFRDERGGRGNTEIHAEESR